jgi:hypothetical protein
MEPGICQWCHSSKENYMGLCGHCHRFPPIRTFAADDFDSVEADFLNKCRDLDDRLATEILSEIRNNRLTD